MRRLFGPGIMLAAALAIMAGASFAQNNAGPIPSPGMGTFGPPFQARSGHLDFGGNPTPTINSACGTGAVIKGTDTLFTLTLGTSSNTGCRVTFAAPYTTSFPLCDASGTVLSTFATDVNGVTMNGGTVDGATYNFNCFGRIQ